MKTYLLPDVVSRILATLFSIIPGFLTCLVAILGGQPFEVQGQNSALQETLGACAAVFVFSTACQLWLTRMGGGGLLVGMTGPLSVDWVQS